MLNKPSWHLVEKATTRRLPGSLRPDGRGRRHSDRGAGRARLAGPRRPPGTSLEARRRRLRRRRKRELSCDRPRRGGGVRRDGDALALKSGRPHYDVDDAVWEASNAVLCHGLDRAADVGCALQLHTEAATTSEQSLAGPTSAAVTARGRQTLPGGRLRGPANRSCRQGQLESRSRPTTRPDGDRLPRRPGPPRRSTWPDDRAAARPLAPRTGDEDAVRTRTSRHRRRCTASTPKRRSSGAWRQRRAADGGYPNLPVM